MSEVCYLIAKSYAKTAQGVLEPTETKRKVYCNKESVSQAEWFQGGRNGLNPAYRFKMFKYDYDGESVIEHNGVQYTIYRTFSNTDEIELYTELRKGNE